jgi:hypothetical protein
MSVSGVAALAVKNAPKEIRTIKSHKESFFMKYNKNVKI